MTDQSLPGPQTEAIWSSGDPTVATSGATWVEGAPGAPTPAPSRSRPSSGEEMLFLGFDDDLALQRTWTPRSCSASAGCAR